jgi:hypothetical protein
MEDLIEAVVGEIDDEHDDAQVVAIVARPGGVFDADARAPLEELEAALGRTWPLPTWKRTSTPSPAWSSPWPAACRNGARSSPIPAATSSRWSRPIRAGCAGAGACRPPQAAPAAEGANRLVAA